MSHKVDKLTPREPSGSDGQWGEGGGLEPTPPPSVRHICYHTAPGKSGCPLLGHWYSGAPITFTLCLGEGRGHVARKGQLGRVSGKHPGPRGPEVVSFPLSSFILTLWSARCFEPRSGNNRHLPFSGQIIQNRTGCKCLLSFIHSTNIWCLLCYGHPRTPPPPPQGY